ncbi:MAG: hypothetical protein MSA90_18520 [Faecalicatena sp.]|uniref:hypothetical protein n=1 Tax=Faecalicatena sp. TaxID=2005360 RepID=UPI00258F3956|nr:hypothetical protein [Faecalicatena sp.]MCI6467444.1 hypothetical protein [Faecalicatena sp.]MDY5618143.1 hypothetical protein [Lachnospiraceae bacterium]
MRQASDEFKILLHNKNRRLLYWAEIRLLDGTILNLTIDDLMQGDGFKVDDATSGTGSFDIGSVIINKLTLKLNNAEDTFSFYDFNGAEVVAYVGMELSNGTLEKIRMGVYTVDEAKSVGITIILRCLDNIRKLDKPYSLSPLKYPATLKEILADACACCGLVLLTQTFEGDEYVVNSRPNDEAVTFREVVNWVAQISCKYARCDALGRLFLSWYGDRSSVLLLQDGGYFDNDKPYSSGVGIDGGTFNPWSNGTAVDSGTFDNMDAYHHLWQLGSLSIGTDDIELTGVSVTLEDEEGEENTYLYGKTGYILNIEKNGLIQDGNHASIAATIVGKKIVGMTIRTFEAGHISDPLIEAGDTVYVTDRKQNSYLTYITNTTFNAGAMQKSSCSAETPAKNGLTRFTNATKAIIESKKAAAKQITEYDKAVQVLTSLITQAFGVFKTAEKQDNDSFIYYMHDKPTLKDSKTVWKMTADAFAVSRDGGKTWIAGMDSSGNAVVNVLSAIGINCDWIHSGTLTLGGINNQNGVLKIVDANGNLIVQCDKDGIKVQKGDIRGTTITLGGNDNLYGLLKLLSSAGSELIRLSKDGIYAKGKYICDDAAGKKRVEIYDGMITLTDAKGQIAGNIWTFNNGEKNGVSINGTELGKTGPSINLIGDYADVYGENVQITGSDLISLICKRISVNGSETKSGKAVFSDGTYLKFKNGMLVSGNTKEGAF